MSAVHNPDVLLQTGSDTLPHHALCSLRQANARSTCQPTQCSMQQAVWSVLCMGPLISTVGLQPACSSSQAAHRTASAHVCSQAVSAACRGGYHYACNSRVLKLLYTRSSAGLPGTLRSCPSAAASNALLNDVSCLVLQSRPPWPLSVHKSKHSK